ncbi:MAG: alanine--tRNA ligase-related protein [Patescibacteria group bacterium]
MPKDNSLSLQAIRRKFLDFYAAKGHQLLPSASLIPENDPTTLFTGSGMQPMLPYLLGEDHPAGKRLANSQKCFRAEDIDEIGDNRHTTVFEMLGNWSLGDYFKSEQLAWLFQFLTMELGLDPNRLYVTVFAGDDRFGLPQDDEAVAIWQKLFQEKGIDAKAVFMGNEKTAEVKGMQAGRIFYYDASKNWWSRAGGPDKQPVGEPGGPDSEIFYEFEQIEHNPAYGKYCHPNCDCGRFVEIGNSVFMNYRKTASGFEKMSQANIDFGGGLERITAAVADEPDIFKIDVLANIIQEIEKLTINKPYSNPEYTKVYRIVADHLRGAVFMTSDGLLPANSDQGYFLRRLIRRQIIALRKLDLTSEGILTSLTKTVAESYRKAYPDIINNLDNINKVILEEEKRFTKTLSVGLKKFKEMVNQKNISGDQAFELFTTYGFPVELTKELANENDIQVDLEGFNQKMIEHKKLSSQAASGKFKGGLADNSQQNIVYHTTTHLLQAALKNILGDSVEQKGSNITPERLRFDFTWPQKLTTSEIKQIEDWVNDVIAKNLPINSIVLPKVEALATQAWHLGEEKYGDPVKIYYVGNSLETALSKEFCGGPHLQQTGEIKGKFKIIKEESISAGVRRIKAQIE